MDPDDIVNAGAYERMVERTEALKEKLSESDSYDDKQNELIIQERKQLLSQSGESDESGDENQT